jgi:hypothetical protein
MRHLGYASGQFKAVLILNGPDNDGRISYGRLIPGTSTYAHMKDFLDLDCVERKEFYNFCDEAVQSFRDVLAKEKLK